MNKFRNNNSNRPPFNLDQQRQQQFQQFQQAQQAQQFHHMMQQQHQQMMGGPQMSKYSKKKENLEFYPIIRFVLVKSDKKSLGIWGNR